MKKCNKCNLEKQLIEFDKSKSNKDGLRSECKACIKIYRDNFYSKPENLLHKKEQQKEYRKANKDKSKATSRAWHKANKNKVNAASAAYYEVNKDKTKAASKNWRITNKDKSKTYHKVWHKANKDKVNAISAKRRASKLQASPSWLTEDHLDEIQMFYTIATWLNGWKMELFEVDHIIPLRGEFMSGLHIPWNLRIVTKRYNRSRPKNLGLIMGFQEFID